MAFALKASPSMSSTATSLSHPMRQRHAAAVPVATRRGRLVVRAVAAVTAPAPAARRASQSAAGERGLSVAEAMSRVKANGKTAFIPYITAADPDLATTAEALRLLDSLGPDVIELGMPFSDPSFDGPVIQASAARALAAGATTDAVMSMLKEVTPELSCPVVIFSYFNPIVRRGTGNFAAAAKEAGVKGLIIPDLPYDEIHGFRKETAENKLELVSVVGVTGARATVNPRVKDLLQEIRQVTDKAVAVGFGISTLEHVSQIAGWSADGVIIGSAMVKQLGEANSPKEGLNRLEVYARSLKNALP
ncbi:hypothetical protein CFC21_074019 [Triticum aestivum]|uniref:tryptophan synthase n=2 Tax=Triticum aestivum TaxID=4565 RepID=A0A9R1HNB8_WHEAT|nr:hypothetical protein CFC21_074019 [Triticum aestivum]